MKIYFHYLLRILGLSVAAWLILKPDWSVTAPGGFELHVARWIWEGPEPLAGWTITGIDWTTTLLLLPTIVMLTWWPIDRGVGASQQGAVADARPEGAQLSAKDVNPIRALSSTDGQG